MAVSQRIFRIITLYSIVGDIGCGNGKNMNYLCSNQYYFIGMDFSEKILEICSAKQLEVFAANNFNIPLNTNCLDHCIFCCYSSFINRRKSYSMYK